MDNESRMEIIRAVFMALLGIVFFIGIFWLFLSRSKAILRTWAKENGFELLSFDKRYMFGTGPFAWWTNSRNQIVFRVRVRDQTGRERSGWVRCGSYWGGVWFSTNAEA